jgi:hypothetical protein
MPGEGERGRRDIAGGPGRMQKGESAGEKSVSNEQLLTPYRGQSFSLI